MSRWGSGMRRCNEPLFWSLFGAGGMLTALLAPVLIVVFGFLVPAGHVDFDRLQSIASSPLGKLAIVVIASLTFVHAAHRLRHTLIELGLKRLGRPIAVGCYSAAVAGSIWSGVVAFS